MNGYSGKILRLNLTNRKITIIPTGKYEKWVGGHGMGSAIFFDLVRDKTIDGFDPANIITMMTSPLSGTLTPAGASRTEMQGIGVQSIPIGWFTRSNFGGRFSSMLKYAGWDGIVIEGQADEPVWLDIRNDSAVIRNCSGLSLWGADTWECQQKIWAYVAGNRMYGDWMEPAGKDGGQTTQRPAVLTIGPAGENLSRMACLIHDAGNGAGQGGFGAVWGSKRLKAISVIGTGSVRVHNPKALMQARLWQKKNYAFNLQNLKKKYMSVDFQSPPVPGTLYRRGKPSVGKRPQACVGCHSACRGRYEDGIGNEATCFASLFYWSANSLDIQRQANDLLNRYGLNATEMFWGELYLRDLHRSGVLGSGREIDCPLDFKKYGELEFAEQLVKAIAYRNDGLGNSHKFGDDLAEGFVRAAKKWGRLDGADGDLKTGRLMFPHWGLPMHKEARSQLDWAYGTILGDRDINEHGFDQLRSNPTYNKRWGVPLYGSAKEVVKIYTDKMVPFQGDRKMLDFSTGNMYSEHIAKLVTWHRYYTRFWKQSAQFCDWRWPDFLNLYGTYWGHPIFKVYNGILFWLGISMPRKTRIDAAGALHHIIARGIDRGKLFQDPADKRNFLERLGEILKGTETRCFAWAIIPNHFHLNLKSGNVPIATVMRKLLTGHALWYNRRHRRTGHLFQNRYKSILCLEDAYLLELVRYIHLNPLRARLVGDLTALDKYSFWVMGILLKRF